jgi:hypothetical protein
MYNSLTFCFELHEKTRTKQALYFTRGATTQSQGAWKQLTARAVQAVLLSSDRVQSESVTISDMFRDLVNIMKYVEFSFIG